MGALASKIQVKMQESHYAVTLLTYLFLDKLNHKFNKPVVPLHILCFLFRFHLPAVCALEKLLRIDVLRQAAMLLEV
jgi:hypothetical protein